MVSFPTSESSKAEFVASGHLTERHPARLSITAWLVLASGIISMVLFTYGAWRWLQVLWNLRFAKQAPDWLQEILLQTQSQVGVRRQMSLRIAEQSMSPALCGIFHPVILLPRSLVVQLSPVQIRTVLLHELFHVRNGDVI